jgi:hypothetical protein
MTDFTFTFTFTWPMFWISYFIGMLLFFGLVYQIVSRYCNGLPAEAHQAGWNSPSEADVRFVAGVVLGVPLYPIFLSLVLSNYFWKKIMDCKNGVQHEKG